MSNVDWSKAPEGAEFYSYGSFFKKVDGVLCYYREILDDWPETTHPKAELYSKADFEFSPFVSANPKDWPETDERIDNIGRNRTEDDMGHYRVTSSGMIGCGAFLLRTTPENTAPNAPERATSDLINKPKHYQLIGDLEAIDVIQRVLTPEQFEGYLIGNFLKYRLRAGKKDDLAQDIAKSEWYRERANNIKSSDHTQPKPRHNDAFNNGELR